MARYDVVVIGGGPGGLSCAKLLANAGAKVILLERKNNIGHKVCAGGITWHGLIRQVPKSLIQRTFPEQHIYSNWQKICYCKQDPIIATVDRKELGRWMMDEAVKAGASIKTGWYVKNVAEQTIVATDTNGKTFTCKYDHLVGADGSCSLVRRSLGIPAKYFGIGINYQFDGTYENMEWHLNTSLFGCGYGWIFPHRETTSIGAYAPRGTIHPGTLKKNLISWACNRGHDLTTSTARSELINFDYRGHQFGNTWLVGDAAGFASGLTGEGINPAIISGEEVAKTIIHPDYHSEHIARIVKKKQRHARIVQLASRSKLFCSILMESLVFILRLHIIDLQKELSM